MGRTRVPKKIAIKARLVAAARILGEARSTVRGMDAAQSFLQKAEANAYSTRDWIIDRRLTALGRRRILVAVNRRKKEVAINFAGTKLAYDAHGVEDIGLDLQLFNSDDVTRHPQILDGVNVIRAAKAKYPGYRIELNGFSLGGAKAIYLGNQEKLDTYTFNPHTISTWLLDSTPAPGVTHSIHRTYKDVPSGGIYLFMGRYPDSYVVHEYDHLKINDTPEDTWDFANLYGGLEKPHRLDNFYLDQQRVSERSTRRVHARNEIEIEPTFYRRRNRSERRVVRSKKRRAQ